MNKKREVNWDDVYRSNYEISAFWDIHWLKSARALIASAKQLEPKVIELWENYRACLEDRNIQLKPDYYQCPYFMLLAFAVENFLKAAIVHKNSIRFKRKFRQDNKFPEELKGHDLIKLAQSANVTFTFEEEDLLRRLTRHAIWAGRYPVPLNFKHSSNAAKFLDGNEYAISWFGGTDVERLNSFIENLESQLGFSDQKEK